MIDETSGYYFKPTSHNPRLTETGKGTPCGELFRRYWMPVSTSASVTTTPKRVRILGEDLILFRTTTGIPGLVYERCAHRGSSLYYGKVDDAGIRCCYHGWQFGPQGHCVDQQCEPDNGSSRRDRIRQPWYPLEERYGLVFAYMGPLDRKPVLPRYDVLEAPVPGCDLVADDSGLSGGSDTIDIIPCNWLQRFDNVLDVFHVYVLHGTFSGPQFVDEFAIKPEVTFEYSPNGVLAHQWRDMPDGRRYDMIVEIMMPNVRIVPSTTLDAGRAQRIGWVVPVDDTHYRLFETAWRPPGFKRPGLRFAGKRWSEMTEAEHQQHPGDFEAQVSQGEITRHSEENLATTDRGLGMMRHMLGSQIKLVEEGKDPAGVAFSGDELVKVSAGKLLKADA